MLAIAGIAVMAVGGIGFANTLTISGSANPLGGDDTNVVASPSADVTDISYTLAAAGTGINATQIDVDVDNTDGSNAHTFDVCVVASGTGGTLIVPLGCQSTGSIAASGSGSASVSLSGGGISAEALDNIAISVEETV